MKQLLLFYGIIAVSATAMIFEQKEIFIISFLGGFVINIIISKKMGWRLPKEIKESHSW